MARGECPPEVARTCPFYARTGQCFTDTDHLYMPACDYDDPIGSVFRNLPRNLEQIRRCDHEDRNRDYMENGPPREKPDIFTMRNEIRDAMEAGEVYLSNRKLKAVFGKYWRQYAGPPPNTEAA